MSRASPDGSDGRTGGGSTARGDPVVGRWPRYIRLTHDIASIANASDSTEEGLMAAMGRLGEALGWTIGHAILERPAQAGRYVDSGLWWFDGDEGEFEPFIEAATGPMREGDGAWFDEVIRTGEPLWMDEDDLDRLDAGRGEAAGELGLRCGLVAPLLIRSRVVGLLELYSGEHEESREELLDAVGQVGIQLGRLIERSEVERRVARASQEEHLRLGRQLNDTLSQQLAGIGMLARGLERTLEDGDDGQALRARMLVESIHEAQQQLRAVVRGLNPGEAGKECLPEAIAGFAADTAEAFGIECRTSGLEKLDFEDDFTANQVFCIVREAVHNAARHANAACIAIEVRERFKRALDVSVSDDGDGFDVASSSAATLGLQSMRYRSRLVGGRLRIRSETGRGTRVVCSLRRGGEDA